MISAAVVYIVVSVLLIAASALIFFRVLRFLRTQNSPSPDAIKREVLPSNSQFSEHSEPKNRAEIIAKLERQFRSSPSADL